jgi:hypothetical protein
MNDIDLESNEWTPIGTDTAPFTGNLDGKDFTINNLKITTSQVYVGLIGYNEGTIKNLKLDNVDINVTHYSSSAIYGAAIIGYNNSISDLDNLHTLSGNLVIENLLNNTGVYVGGLIGYLKNSLTIANSSNKITIHAILGFNVGGLLGYSNENVIFNFSSNTGNIIGRGLVAGLLGRGGSFSISNSSNSGSVSGSRSVGGLVGSGREGSINDSYNEGVISLLSGSPGFSGFFGGLIGVVNRCTITNSYNSGKVNNNLFGKTGGLVGQGQELQLTLSYNIGNVYGYSNVGGLVGESQNIIINDSFNDANVNGGNSVVGGLVGLVSLITIKNSFNRGLISGGKEDGTSSGFGGLVAEVKYEINIEASFNSGDIISKGSSIGGLLGEAPGAINSFTEINNSYNVGNISGIDRVGGLIGASALYSSVTIISSFNAGLINGRGGVGGLIGRAEDTLYIYFSLNLGDVISLDSTSVGSITGYLPPDNMYVKTYFSCNIIANGVSVDGVAFGTKVTDLSTFNLAFFTTTLEWDTEIWHFTGLNIPNGVYPTLKNMPEIPVEE